MIRPAKVSRIDADQAAAYEIDIDYRYYTDVTRQMRIGPAIAALHGCKAA